MMYKERNTANLDKPFPRKEPLHSAGCHKFRVQGQLRVAAFTQWPFPKLKEAQMPNFPIQLREEAHPHWQLDLLLTCEGKSWVIARRFEETKVYLKQMFNQPKTYQRARVHSTHSTEHCAAIIEFCCCPFTKGIYSNIYSLSIEGVT